MFSKWSRKEVQKFFICLIVYILLVFFAAFIGLAGPVFWTIVYPIVSAFLTAGAVTCIANMKQGFGSVAVLPLIVFLLSILIGEISMALMAVWIIAILALSEILHMTLGPETKTSLRFSVPVASISALGQIFPLYITKDAYLEKAAEEMSAEYVEGLGNISAFPLLLLTAAACLAAASLSERITERMLTKK